MKGLKGYPRGIRKRLCFLFGHVVTGINYKELTAHCAWCDAELEVSYDMCLGETVIIGVKER